LDRRDPGRVSLTAGKNAPLAINAAAHRRKIVWYQGLKAIFVELRAAEFWFYGRGPQGIGSGIRKRWLIL
jgi:hypothetical protein